MIKSVKIDQVSIKEQKTVTGKSGKPWTFYPVGIKSKGEWINLSLNNKPNWQIGEEVELDIWKDEKYGWKAKLPSKEAKLETANTALEAQLKTLELRIDRLEGKLNARDYNLTEPVIEEPPLPPEPTEEISPEDIPF